MPLTAFAADTITNPLGEGYKTASALAGRGITLMFSVSGSIALLMFVWGGFLYLTSAGDSKRVTQGTDAMKWAVIGLAVMFFSYVIVNFVFNSLITASK